MNKDPIKRPGFNPVNSGLTENIDNNTSTLLKSITINNDVASESLADSVHNVESNYTANSRYEKRVIFMRNTSSTSTETLTVNSEPGDGHSSSGYGNDVETDIGEVCEEIKQRHGHELSEKVSEYSNPVPEEIDKNSFEDCIDNIPQETGAEELVASCAHCSKPRRIENVSSLKKGQHIKLPGAHLKFNFGRKLIKVYHHHAIVKRIIKISENSVEMVLIHFSKVESKIAIHEATNVFNLENDEIDIIDYERPKYCPETIVQRAESMLPTNENGEETKRFRSYNFVCCNCEHFATWCVVGDGKSFQANGFFETSANTVSKLAGVGTKCWRFFKRFMFNASDEIAAGSGIELNLPGVLLGASAFIYLCYTVCMTIYYRFKYAKRQLCKVCFKRKIIALWSSFGAYFVTSGISYIIVHFALPLLAPIPGGTLLLALVLLSLTLQWGIKKVVKALRSPYACDKIAINHLSQITPGSMISFKYFGIPHNAIVIGKYVESDEPNKCVIRYVHYGAESYNVFSTRAVTEECFLLKLDDNIKSVKLVDCRHLKTFPPDVVISRAKARLGEKTWSAFTNRSDHLCFDAKVQDASAQNDCHHESDDRSIMVNSKSKKESTFYLGKKEIHLRSDLEIGHIVNLNTKSEKRAVNGIVVWLEDIDYCSEQAFKMDLIVYRDYWATRRQYSVDLKRERLFIKKYHPAHCCPFNKRVSRARQKEGKKGDLWTEKGFLISCILK